MPTKEAASIQKLFFNPLNYGAFHGNWCIFKTQGRKKSNKTHLFRTNSKGAATIQERPLLAQVRYDDFLFLSTLPALDLLKMFLPGCLMLNLSFKSSIDFR